MTKRTIAVWLLLLNSAAGGQQSAPPPPFRASLHADCTLGSRAENYFVTVDRISATYTRIVFKPARSKGPVSEFTVPGVMAEFEENDTALVLTFENPGPTTRAFTLVNGKVRQAFECTSRFGALAFPLFRDNQVHNHCLVCLQGEEMVGHDWLPTTAKFYVYTETGYKFDGEVPFAELYRKLAATH